MRLVGVTKPGEAAVLDGAWAAAEEAREEAERRRVEALAMTKAAADAKAKEEEDRRRAELGEVCRRVRKVLSGVRAREEEERRRVEALAMTKAAADAKAKEEEERGRAELGEVCRGRGHHPFPPHPSPPVEPSFPHL
jgi:hypothetical protein